MRRLAASLVLSLSALLGCAHQAVLTPSTGSTSHLPVTSLAIADRAQTIAGRYTLTIDRDSLAATIQARGLRTAQENDDLYVLPITNFLRTDSLRMLSISESNDTIDLRYRVTHPFAAPADPTAPATASNRADLGISGIVMLLAPVTQKSGHLYFAETPGDEVVAETDLVTNADGYFRPTGLVAPTSLANTYPYKLLVDEIATQGGSRVGVSNGDDPTGNYGADGWTRAEFGPSNTGWTGYGVLHQGQASDNLLRLDLETVRASGPIAMDLVILATYTDPRGGLTVAEKRANRLPPATPDTSLFAYRMPHGALDVQRIVYQGATGAGFRQGEVSSSTLRFQVEDWDARATETVQSNLALESDPTLVAQGEAGLPGFAICIPGVLGGPEVIDTWDPSVDVLNDDTDIGGDPEADAGLPGDALYYSREVSKPGNSGEIASTYTGLARAVDPQPAILTTYLDATLQPLTAELPEAVTYQCFTVELQGPTAPDFGWAKLLDPGDTKWAEATGVAIGPYSEVYVCGFFHQTIDFGGGLRSTRGGMDNFVVKFSRAGEYQWDYCWGSTSDDNYRFVRVDANGSVYVGGSFDAPTDFDQGGPLAPFPNHGREDAFLLRLSPAGALQWVQTFGDQAAAPEAEVAKCMTVDMTGVYLGGFFRSSGLRFTAADPTAHVSTISAAFIVKLLPNGNFAWSRTFDGGLHDEMRGIASDPVTGGLLGICDYYSDFIEFGGGQHPNTDPSGETDDMVLLRLLATDGRFDEDVHFVGSSIEQPQALDAKNGYVAVTGHTWSTDLNLGGGVLPHAGSSDFYWGRFDSTTLAHQFSGMLGSEAYDPGFGVAVDPTGAVYVSGLFQGGIDFGFGPVTPVMQDGFLYKLAPDGTPAWVHTWGGAVDFVRSQGLACDAVSVVAVGTSGVGGPIDYEPGTNVFDLTGAGICGSVIRDLSDGTW